MHKLSIIIPLYNEEESLHELHAEIDAVAKEHDLNLEIIMVDDGSSDRSWQIVEELAAKDERINGIRFRTNFGKAAALIAGMRSASGRILMMMDADLQDDPAEIPRMLELIDQGYDVVNGWKQRRLDPWHKVYPSKVFNWMVSKLNGLDLHDHNCGLKMFRSEVASELRIYGELHRFIAVLAHSRGFKVAELPVHHRSRQFGHSKYGVRRFLRGFLDLLTVKFLTGFGYRPQHMLGAFGLGAFLIGAVGLLYLVGIWILTNIFRLDFAPIGSRPLLAYSVAFTLLGAQALTLGLLAELIVAYTGRESQTYSIAQRTAPVTNKPIPTTDGE
ncbi:MAG: glycosyltransferase family 2 protein, partial [Planctomycetaceae bacterium]